MWQVNETLSFDGKPYRILLTETSYFYWIALDENKGLPEKIYFDECNHWVDEGRVERIPDPYAYLQGESWAKESSVYQECSGQLKLATVLEFFRYWFSDSFGGNPPLYSCGLTSL